MKKIWHSSYLTLVLPQRLHRGSAPLTKLSSIVRDYRNQIAVDTLEDIAGKIRCGKISKCDAETLNIKSVFLDMDDIEADFYCEYSIVI